MKKDELDSKKIHEAAQTLNLGDRASMKEIKSRYRYLIKKWHPDKCGEDREKYKEKTSEVVHAYETIMAYCENYLYSFEEEDIVKNLPVGVQMKERWNKQYGNDPMWS